MKSVLSLVCAVTLHASFPGAAQQVPAPAPDTAGYRANAGSIANPFMYYQGELTRADGSVLRAYLPVSQLGFEKSVEVFLSIPGVNSRAVRKTFKVADLRAMNVHGQYYEALQLGLKEPSILALRVADGAVELFVYADPRPVSALGALGPGGLIAGAMLTHANNRWYVRREGQLTEVSRVFFATQMSDYLDDVPDVAQHIAAGAKHYGYADMPAIIAEFNARKAGTTRKEKP